MASSSSVGQARCAAHSSVALARNGMAPVLTKLVSTLWDERFPKQRCECDGSFDHSGAQLLMHEAAQGLLARHVLQPPGRKLSSRR